MAFLNRLFDKFKRKTDEDNLILLARFADPHLGQIAKSVLESHDIPCFIFDTDHTIQPWMSMSGARLMVMQSDLTMAKQIFKTQEIEYE